MEKEIIDLITEELIKKFLSDEEKLVEERYDNGSWYNVQIIPKRALSTVTSVIYQSFLKRIQEKEKEFMLEKDKLIKQSIKEYFSKDKIKENLDNAFKISIENVTNIKLNTIESDELKSIINKSFENINRNTKNQIKELSENYVWNLALDYFNENKEKIFEWLKKDMKYIIKIIPESVSIEINWNDL